MPSSSSTNGVAGADASPRHAGRAQSWRASFRKPRLALSVIALAALVAFAVTGTAIALQALGPAGKVNEDPAAGIDPTLSVSGEDPANADVVGGSLKGGKPAVPWAAFRQTEPPGSSDQIFARSFAGGSWTTRGNGTVGGRSSGAPHFSGSLNFDQAKDGEAPSIDFAGTERTVPWASWYENTHGTGFEGNNVFASRFDNTGDANQGKWIFGGQSRGLGGGDVPVPSLNIDPNQSAENPSIAGGSAVDPTKPGPWVTWQEFSGLEGVDEIFAVRPIGPGAANCDGVKPAGVPIEGHVPAIGGICWQQTGIPRDGENPSLNVDIAREGVEPDIAFAGLNDGVPWIVWYEKGVGTVGLHQNEMVFAAKAVSDGEAANGGFHWVVVGQALSATLDTSGTNKMGKCAESAPLEARCSLNMDTNGDAENPRVAAGTMNPANPTSPWITWEEKVGAVKQVFVSHLVGTGAEAHFELANGGAPISTGTGDSTRPDITFSGNTPYVSWREEVGGTSKAFTGHFANPGTFVLDQGDVSLTPTAQADVREPISSSCIATPFNMDGASCQGGAAGTPFFLFTAGTSPRGLFANAYAPEAPVTGGATVGGSSAVVNATVNPKGATVKESFEFGTTTAYGQSTASQRSAPVSTAVPFSAQLSGLPAGTTIHYRAVASSDFGSFVGADRTLTTAPAPPATVPGTGTAAVGRVTVLARGTSGPAANVKVTCGGAAGAMCSLTLRLTVVETLKGHRLLAASAVGHKGGSHRTVVVGTARVSLSAGQTKTVRVVLNRTGKRLVSRLHGLRAKLQVRQSNIAGGASTVFSKTVAFKSPSHRHGTH
jgi:hypothetical protein